MPSLEEWAELGKHLPAEPTTVDLSAISGVYEQATGYLELGSLPPWLKKGGGKAEGKDGEKKSDSVSDLSDEELDAAIKKLEEGDDSPKAKALRAEKAKRAKGGDSKDDKKFPAFLDKK